MLVIISDLHLTDGTTGATIHPGALPLFTDRLCDLAYRASWRADGSYRPIDQIDLVLLGDILDVTHSTRWLDSEVRPWDDVRSPQFAQTVADVVQAILARNAEAAASLRALSADGAIRTPPATHSRRPVGGAEGRPTPVSTYYMAGNHDWFFHLRGESYNRLRRTVVRELGLAHSPEAPFAHDPAECEALLAALRRHRVIARHGDIYDSLNFGDDRDSSSIGDAIVVELTTRFAVEIERELGDDLPAPVAWGLKEIDHIRPLLLVPAWIDGLLERACPAAATRHHVKRIWDWLVDEFLELEIVRRRDTWRPVDLVDGLQQALKFSRHLSIGWASSTAAWLQRLRSAEADSYYSHALTEPDFRNRRARHIVYGHTHGAESVPLDASYADGFVLNQMYFNAGAWRRVYRPTKWAPREHEFIPSENMTLLAFFAADERGGRSFETWSGSLGISSVEPSRYRLDSSQASQVQGQPSSSPASPVGPPHFHAAPAAARAASAHRIQ